ncbi:hypothetical protein RhiJN_05921 [Ceratobasidium sp. AG-Ba]|nr:hypothetical protein RhiJN_05921 [Ceratobasidium sp. AG-Ba]QRW06844.1 hypothetical protein RhiLY_05843 [Ceratobasidium sp. AG-Ba]
MVKWAKVADWKAARYVLAAGHSLEDILLSGLHGWRKLYAVLLATYGSEPNIKLTGKLRDILLQVPNPPPNLLRVLASTGPLPAPKPVPHDPVLLRKHPLWQAPPPLDAPLAIPPSYAFEYQEDYDLRKPFLESRVDWEVCIRMALFDRSVRDRIRSGTTGGLSAAVTCLTEDFKEFQASLHNEGIDPEEFEDTHSASSST